MLDADALRISQVLANLLTNAAKYTEHHGTIRLSAERAGNEVVIRVIDNGIGLAPADLPRVFEMFAQVKPTLDRKEAGLGIGLALSRALVELHGGTIEGRSEGSARARNSPCGCNSRRRSRKRRHRRLDCRLAPGQQVVPRNIAFFRTANNPGLRQASNIAAMIPGSAGP